jgi:hypothetical protein
MKKMFVFMFFVLCNICFANDDFIIKFDIGTFGIRTSNTIGNGFDFDLNGNLFNLCIENSTTSIGIDFTPINYFYSTFDNEHLLSFSTIYFYWNLYHLFRSYTTRYIVGPFFSIKTFNITNFENFNTNIFISTGLIFTRKIIIHKSKK